MLAPRRFKRLSALSLGAKTMSALARSGRWTISDLRYCLTMNDWFVGLIFLAWAVGSGIAVWFLLGRGLLRDLRILFRKRQDRWKPPLQ